MRIEYDNDNWWTGDALVQPVIKVAISIFEAAFPECKVLFMFDNATSHSAYALDALQARSMSLRPGGAQSLLRSDFNPHTGKSQVMIFPNGQAKGLKVVLEGS